MLGDTKLGPAKNGAPVLESKGGNGAIRVMGGATGPATGGETNVDMTDSELADWKKTRGSIPVSADSPGNDPRVMEYQDKAIADANKDQTD
jgi:hypothetical protein